GGWIRPRPAGSERDCVDRTTAHRQRRRVAVTGAEVLAGLAGMAIVAGGLLMIAGLRPVDRPATDRRRPRCLVGTWPGWRRALVSAAAAVTTLLATGWPVAALGGAAVVIGAPRLLSARQAAAQLARMEALEAWTRRLGDILGSGVGGLEQ